MSKAELESEGLMELRWWTLLGISESTDRFRPEGFVALVDEALEHGAPATPLIFEATERF